MTYDHEKAKVLYPAGAAEVERLREELEAVEADNETLRKDVALLFDMLPDE